MKTTKRSDGDRGDALDVLEREDNRIRLLFERLAAPANRSPVIERYDRGNVCKQLIRRVAIRESARDDIADALAKDGRFTAVTDRLGEHRELRRETMDHMEHMARGIQGIALNEGQDFDGAVTALESVISPEIDWELNEGIRLIAEALPDDARAHVLHSARYLGRHGPSHLRPNGTRWYQRMPLVRRMMTVRGHLEDYPRAARGTRS